MSASPNVLASPTLSADSSSSFVMLSSNPLSPRATPSEDEDDQIVYNVSEDSFSPISSSASDPASDDDFVVLSRPRSSRNFHQTGLSTPDGDDESDESDRARTPSLANLAADLEKLTVNDSALASRPKQVKRALKSHVVSGAGAIRKSRQKATSPSAEEAAASYPSPGPSPARPKRVSTPLSAATKQERAVVKGGSKRSKKKKAIGLGARSVVDDASERFSEYGETEPGSPSVYEEAVGYINSFLSNPAARKNSACRLTLLQALIIELGLASSSLPASLTSAKAFLKSRAFLNIKEYLAVREQGPAAVQRIMHPNRNALIKDIRKNKNTAPLGWVKDSGLQVLLVQCHH